MKTMSHICICDRICEKVHSSRIQFFNFGDLLGMLDRCEAFRDCRTTIPLSSLNISTLYSLNYAPFPKSSHTYIFVQIVNISRGSGTCGGMPELLLTSSIVLSVICLFVFPCVLACTVPAVALSIAVSC